MRSVPALSQYPSDIGATIMEWVRPPAAGHDPTPSITDQDQDITQRPCRRTGTTRRSGRHGSKASPQSTPRWKRANRRPQCGRVRPIRQMTLIPTDRAPLMSVTVKGGVHFPACEGYVTESGPRLTGLTGTFHTAFEFQSR